MRPLTRRNFLAAAGIALPGAILGGAPVASQAAPSPHRVPIIYSTDLTHPHVDPDDHFDLACIYSIPEVDVRAIILDNGALQAQRPGYKPVWQMNYLTGRHVSAAIGLNRLLKSPGDRALDQPAEHQFGVNLILQTLQDSREKMAIITLGSVRDTVVAFNREPKLFREKVRGIYSFIGEASDPAYIEYNVALDTQAYLGLMRSDLPVFWVPCFDGGLWQNKGHASFWKIRQGQVLEKAPLPLQRYFLYMLHKETADPIEYLSQPMNSADRQWLMDGERNLWCAAVLGMVAGRHLRHEGHEVCGFSRTTVSLNNNGTVNKSNASDSHEVMRFEIKDQANFAAAATKTTADLLTKFPLLAINKSK